MNVIITSYAFVAAVIGAGFASGQEILAFFTVHGKWGAAAIVLAAAIFGAFAYFVLDVCRRESLTDYGVLLRKIMSKRACTAAEVLTVVFMLCSLAVMTACFGEMSYMMFGIGKRISEVIFIAVCMLIVCIGADGALKLNGVLGIITASGIAASALYLLRYREHQVFAPQITALVSGAGYSGYNLIGAGVILAPMSKNIKSKYSAAAAGAVSAAALGVMMLLIYAILSIYRKHINLGEIPMLTLAMRENMTISYFYFGMLLLAVVTTAVADGVGISAVVPFGSKYTAAACMGAAALILSGAGFSTVINTAYRLCGYAGIIMILYTVIKYKKYEKSRKKKNLKANSRKYSDNSL
ncbi:MAG: hypothetical protein SOS24_09115 [Clostridia bacterium]|nr:hypothetical protein [Clostridia bacterium]